MSARRPGIGDLVPCGGSVTIRAAVSETSELVEGTVVDVTNVEIVQTGMMYPLASGPHTFTEKELSHAVESQEDPAIKAPRLKLGHLANIGLMADGQPAVGTLGNLRLEQSGHLVVGDYLGMPSWLANILPSAYPARSIEANLGVSTNTGHNWECVITDLALLGVVWPGVGTLEDIKALYSVNGPENVQILSTREEVEAVAGRAVVGELLQAQIDVSDVSKAYYNQLEAGQFWWWIRSMYMEPNELIVEDEDKGDLYRVPFKVEGEEVSFEDPIKVKIQYIDKPDKKEKEAAASAAIAAMVTVNPKWASQDFTFKNRKESRMGVIASDVDPVALRTSLGLEADATDDEVRAALETAGVIAPPGQEEGGTGAPSAETPGTTESGAPSTETGEGPPDNTAPGGGQPTDPETGQSTQAPGGNGEGDITPPTEQASGEFVKIDRGTYNKLLAGAEAGLRLDKEGREAERDRVISAAIEQGKIPPSRRDHYVTAWNNDPDGTRSLLTAAADKGGLAPGLVPVIEAGGVPTEEDLTVEAYPADWLPEVQRGGEK